MFLGAYSLLYLRFLGRGVAKLSLCRVRANVSSLEAAASAFSAAFTILECSRAVDSLASLRWVMAAVFPQTAAAVFNRYRAPDVSCGGLLIWGKARSWT